MLIIILGHVLELCVGSHGESVFESCGAFILMGGLSLLSKYILSRESMRAKMGGRQDDRVRTLVRGPAEPLSVNQSPLWHRGYF